MKKIFFISVLYFMNLIVFTQVTPEWIKTYNGIQNKSDIVTGMVKDKDNNVIVTGHINNNQFNPRDVALIKYTPSGDVLWTRVFGFSGNDDIPRDIETDLNGNIYVTGYSSTSLFLIKYNNIGDSIWVKYYNTNSDARDLVLDKFGNIYVTGTIIGNNFDYLTAKFDSSGALIWSRTYSGPGFDESTDIVLDTQLNIYITGNSYGNGTGSNFRTIKYSNDGEVIWQREYNGSANSGDYPSALRIDSFDNVYVSGTSDELLTSRVFTTIKYNANGDVNWIRKFDPGGINDFARDMLIAVDNNIYVVGQGDSANGYWDIYLVKYNSNGDVVWQKRFNTELGSEDPVKIVSFNQNIYVAYNRYMGGYSQFCILKLNSSGMLQWDIINTEYSNGYNECNYLIVDNNGIYLSGNLLNGSFAYDFFTLRYSQPVGSSSISIGCPIICVLSQNYPNPFNPVTNIKFDIPKQMVVKITIYDILGKEVSILANEEMNAGSYSVDWDASNYPSGVYFYKITAGDFSESRKMVLVK